MGRYVEGQDRHQVTLLPECLEDYIAEDNPVRVIEAFVEELDLQTVGFERAQPAHKRAGRRTTRRCYSRSTSTATSIGSRRAGAWSVSASAM